MNRTAVWTWLVLWTVSGAAAEARQENNQPPAGFTALFNGKDLSGWRGMETIDPRAYRDLEETARQARDAANDADMRQHWRAENGEIVNDGHGVFLSTDADFRDYELWIDYKTVPQADSGIYLKGTPQVQIWDSTKEGGKWEIGADKGSGGLWNNTPGTPGRDPLVLADKPFGEWNRFHIIQVGDRTSIWLNGQMVVDRASLENYWDKNNPEFKDAPRPIVAAGPIQLQTHGGEIRWRNIFVREVPAEEANRWLAAADDRFEPLLAENDFAGWAGPTENYEIAGGVVKCKPGHGGTIYTEREFADFVVRLEFKLPPAGNNGLAIRFPGEGDTAYQGMCELQVLDNEHESYAKLDPRQYHGSAYGMVAAHRGYLRPTGEWNYQEVTVRGSKIRVELNGTTILDADLAGVTEYMADSPHPGKERPRGHFGFAGHGDPVEFRNVRILELK